jgi:site-specific DNA-methyltransferase (adenine-specific)
MGAFRVKPYFQDEHVTIYRGDCREVLPSLPLVDVVLTDPPYPNGMGHFTDGIVAATDVLRSFKCARWLVFWDELSTPPVALPLVAHHIWFRTNTNRPDNYESIYEFNTDCIKRASRVFPFAVIAEGLTGCFEATGHPTQKNKKLMSAIIQQCAITGVILDPFMGSGTTLRAAKDCGIKAIGIEIEERYCEIAARRMAQQVLTFDDVVTQPQQLSVLQ